MAFSVKELLIKILTRGDTAGAKKTNKALDATKGKTKQVGKSVDQAEQSSKGFFRRMLGGFKGIPGPAAAAAAGVGLIVLALRKAYKALKAFSKQQLSEVDLDSALAQMSQLTDDYRLRLHDLASEMQELTNIGDDMWLKAFGQLTRFGMTSENVDQVTEALKNLTGLLDGNFQSATMLIQRALEGNFEMFTRYGITIEKTGDKTKDLDNLFRMLAEKGGGVMEARAKTLDGQLTAMKNSWGDLTEATGKWIAKTQLAQGWARIFKDAANDLEEALKDTSPVMDELARKADQNFAAAMVRVKAAVEPVTKDLTALAGIDLSNAAKAAETLAKKLGDAASEAQRARDRIDAIEDAELGKTIAEIDVEVAQGAITSEQGELRKLRARHAAAERKRLRASETINERIQTAQDAIAEIEEKRRKAHADAQQAIDRRRILEERYGPVEQMGAGARRAAQELSNVATKRLNEYSQLLETERSMRDEAEKSLAAAEAERKVLELRAQQARLTTNARALQVDAAMAAKEQKAQKDRLDADLKAAREQLREAERKTKDKTGAATAEAAAGREVREAETAEAAYAEFRGRTAMGRGAGGIGKLKELREAALRERAEADAATESLAKAQAALIGSYKALQTTVKNLESQIKNLDV